MHQKQQPPRRGEAPAAAVPPGHYAAAGQPFFRPPPPSDSDPPGAGQHRAPPPDRPGHRYAAPAERPLPRPPGSSADRPLPRPPPGSSDHPAPTTPPGGPMPSRGPPPHAYPAGMPRRRSSSSALASCLAATAFLLLSAGGVGAALFLLFRPRPPDIAVAAVRLPSFAAANGTVAFTFQQTASVRNPNRSPLAHFDSSLRVAYAGGDLGSVYIPAGLIDGGRTKDMSATFDVPAIPVADQPQQQQMGIAATQQQQPQQMVIEVESLLVIKGRVKMLRLLTHRVQAAKVCRVGVSPVDGRVLGFRC
ncbi:hypothetical protein C2845_PM07G40110 [Panicum miliaceum]|uniref:Late embryogenesis abundant protein LEA-2 subgroup domain-containing protein n=1 Tax=Panicum miliaceum TaxID=4540 RepID=A0A3L6SNX5_PANMI|nr:hypothetical protein C2845_PM07G40110 [Panicum miliaceum]